MRRKSSRRRRSATQWARLLTSWDRATTSAADFAKSLGVARGTLAWWCWRLKHTPADDTVRFVQVEVAHETTSLEAPSDWEFTCAAGHTLRVRGGVEPELLRLVLDHMTARRAR